MRLKSFTARTLPEAMRRVREALGPDAVMLSNQPSEDGKGVRVTAAVEDGPLDDFGFDPAVGGISPIDGISEALTYHRIPPALFDRLIGAAAILSAQDPALVLAAALDNEFTFLPLTDTAAQCPIMLVGPPGAGKTATTAKLCARARMAGGEVSLITMDTVKSGGMAQISAFAEALKARLQPAADIDALAAAVKETTADQLVIIDTVGANPFNDDDMDHIFLAAKAAGATPILVLRKSVV